jgi:hypothetical protein
VEKEIDAPLALGGGAAKNVFASGRSMTMRLV